MYRTNNIFGSSTTTLNSEDLLSNNDKIIIAILNKKITELKRLVKRDNINNILNRFNETALHFAVRQNDLNIIQYLLELGANPLAIQNDNKTCFEIASEQNKIYLYQYLSSNKSEDIKKLLNIKENEITNLINKNENLTNENINLKDENKYLKKTRDDIDKKISSLNKELDDTKKESSSRKRKLDETEMAYENLNSKYMDLKRNKK